MHRYPTRLRVACLLLCMAGHAVASEFAVTPVSVALSPAHATESLTVRNPQARTLRFSIVLKRWTMDSSGQWQLTESNDLVLNPRMLEVPAGQSKLLRVGSLAPMAESEIAYRIEMAELPDPQFKSGKTNGFGLQVLTNLSLPVFVLPRAPRPVFSISKARIEKGVLVMLVNADGNVHLGAQAAALRVNGTGAVQKVYVGYVLPGSHVEVKVPLEKSECAGFTSLSLTVAETTEPLTASLTGPRGCGG